MVRYYNFSVPGHEEERIIIFTRRHFISFLIPMVITAILTILPIILAIFLGTLFEFVLSNIALQAVILILTPYYLLLATYFFTGWISYYYNLLIVTPNILVDVEQKTIFSRDISHVHLLQVEDISCRIKGIIPSLFDYGDIIIQTAGSEEHTVIKNVPNAQETSALILKLHREILEKRK